MAERIDILEDEDGDELFEDGDFAIGPADEFHVRDLLVDSPGEWRQHPAVGLLINRYKNASSDKRRKFESEVRQALENDGYRVERVNTSMENWWKNFIVDCEPIK